MKNTFLNMVLALGGITLVCGIGVGLVHRFTEEPIRMAREAGVRTGLSDVLPPFDMITSEVFRIDGEDVRVHTAVKGGRTAGYAVETFTNRGFSGQIRMLVGFTPDYDVSNIIVLEHTETPGFGDAITDPGNPLLLSFKGKNLSRLRLALEREGGNIDGLTGATITSRAYIDAVARAFDALMRQAGNVWEGIPADGMTGATGAGAETGTDGETGATKTTNTQTDGTTGATRVKPQPQTDGMTGATKTESGSETDGVTGATGTAETDTLKGGKEGENE